MVFRVLLYISLAIFIFGMAYRIFAWFNRTLTIYPTDNISPSDRFFASIEGLVKIIFSIQILKLLKSILLYVILQKKTFEENKLRWAMHIMIYWGFTLLLIMHALGNVLVVAVYKDYYSTINPFFFLRDLFGLLAIIGIAIAVCRRAFFGLSRLRTNAMDIYAIIIVAVIMITGILLTGVKISSYSSFKKMVEEYSDLEDEEDIRALESLWVKDFGLVSPNVKGPFEQKVIELGATHHEMNCLGCHSASGWAFTGFAAAKIINPIALRLDRIGSTNFLYYLHVLACFFGLAYLPFSKMLHIISTPLSLITGAIMVDKKSDPVNITTRQLLELDACTHCGTCSLYCSAMMAYEAVKNEFILPSEKMVFLKKMASGKALSRDELKAILEGVYLCTNCDRCTVVCPSGIRLKELWINVRESLLQKGIPEPLLFSPLSLVRGLLKERVSADDYNYPVESANRLLAGNFDTLNNADAPVLFPVESGIDKDLRIENDTFSNCFGCYNCTTACPVVNSYENPQKSLGLLPHQIMCCLGLGLDEIVLGPRMLWDCVTCYQCQEHCPQQVKVADILYELKNRAVKRVKS